MAHKPTRSSTPFVIREIKIRTRMRDRYTPIQRSKMKDDRSKWW